MILCVCVCVCVYIYKTHLGIEFVITFYFTVFERTSRVCLSLLSCFCCVPTCSAREITIHTTYMAIRLSVQEDLGVFHDNIIRLALCNHHRGIRLNPV